MLRLSTICAIAQLDALTAQLDGGSLKLYSGTAPGEPDLPLVSATELVSFDLNTPAFEPAVAASVGAEAALDPPASVAATATGNAQFFRLYDSADVCVLEGTVTDALGTGDLRLPSVSVVSGVIISVVDYKINQPK